MSISKVVKDLKGRLDEKVCIITGGGSGIGFEASVLFAREGADVVVVDIDLKAAEATVERIKEKTGPIHVRKHAIAMKCDVSKEAEVKKVVEDTLKEFGKLDVMLNNAGIMHAHDDDALNTDEKVWDLTMDINLKGVWFGCKYAIEAFRKRKNGGNIINIASFVGLMGSATPQLAYTASKGAVIALSRELAIIHARENIRVNALCPGPLRTPLLMNYLDTEEKKNRRLVHIPIGRFGEPIEIANAALFLASDESTYVTGVEFKVDGGLTAAYVTPEGPCTSVPPKNFKKVSEEKN
ncbi:short-chain dehydrogenase [Rhizophagus irregularis]|uniref:Short-chain dehydrogenase n=3 Tax=Rhizophagus irregularis TaxID=588596 RepID=A0A2I1EDG0_9GLOM|nr:short-chain dehydrogenase [Rhizophagus irregularis DAOM 181602=DAOM 197198]EXX72122.1 bifunctional hydroxyacyl-CoA dehydrogenase/enoyl-CoA hydratase FOX2 [Rhizophagus irregularis DAOM 197198w]PKC11823.1 short-chain dehydrogenase [Rhizophagus irregularis]PKC70409.1 short-chain dehydrogenase [Rhizophagus irregularis]PKY20164.1 short-chain dehydrogenase [Rhizophagus irregularis]POG69801.1 short-chain dehydrogenase [Rhizophagus irregularis DAOM 181602=DAOM 197198]|eukprot:XP_025176667.1 short-chain dehydrogenase [Rhizophagus irregularis DAOM 181602=DAOM 197198]